MVIVKLSGGLGNQLFQYFAGYALAQKRRQPLYLDTSFYASQKLRNLDIEKLGIILDVASDKDCLKLGAPNSLVNKVIHKVGFGKIIFPSYFQEDRAFELASGLFNCTESIYLDGYWQNLNYFTNVFQELSSRIKLNVLPTTRYSEYRNLIDRDESVSLHIRRGDYVFNKSVRKTHYVCDISYYKRSINFIRSLNENITIFLFSDDMDWCVAKFGNLENIIFIDKLEDDVEEFFLMSQCTYNIISNSTFSLWAALLNKNSSPHIIAPSLWKMGVKNPFTTTKVMKTIEIEDEI